MWKMRKTYKILARIPQRDRPFRGARLRRKNNNKIYIEDKGQNCGLFFSTAMNIWVP
jgi:hypothetical protein